MMMMMMMLMMLMMLMMMMCDDDDDDDDDDVRSGSVAERAVNVQDHRRCLDVQCRTQSRWLCSLHSLAGRFVLVS